jgi:hypothetical protein
MLPPDALSVLAAFFIFGMIWLRTRMQYARRGTGRRTLTAAGVGYFAGVALLILAGWFIGSLLARQALSLAPLSAALVRGVWLIAVYYLSIGLNRALLARGRPVFA